MAINTSNSNFVNINSLPKSQEVLGSDLFILQTENGTQTITFENLNVVKTNPNGETVLPGSLTGEYVRFDTVSASSVISSPLYVTESELGFTGQDDYYNRFTFSGGLITSANYVENASPDYVYISQTLIPNLTAYQNQLYKRVVEFWGYTDIQPTNKSSLITIANFFYNFSDITINAVKRPDLFTITLGTSSLYVPYIPYDSIIKSGNNLNFNVDLGYVIPIGGAPVRAYWRFLYLYNSTLWVNVTALTGGNS